MDELGLYIHIPFCSQLCHYCDFRKTANYSSEIKKKYFHNIERDLSWHLDKLDPQKKLTSVFFGGGTPGLFTTEIGSILDLIRPALSQGCEISLEANPNNISKESLNYWIKSGVNRVSIGVQSFHEENLQFLKRDHNNCDVFNATELLKSSGITYNIDLIYGSPYEDKETFLKGLNTCITSNTPHLSLYNLTYEGNTPIARAERRGKLKATDDDELYSFYFEACKLLRAHGYVHEEVSNWSLPGHSCRHNWLYWSDLPFISVGVGGHGYDKFGALFDYSPPLSYMGTRYENALSIKAYTESEKTEDVYGVIDRDLYGYLAEKIGCSFRCSKGVDIEGICRLTGKEFKPTPAVSKALSSKILNFDGKCLTAIPSEWFRETAWSYEILESFNLN